MRTTIWNASIYFELKVELVIVNLFIFFFLLYIFPLFHAYDDKWQWHLVACDMEGKDLKHFEHVFTIYKRWRINE